MKKKKQNYIANIVGLFFFLKKKEEQKLPYCDIVKKQLRQIIYLDSIKLLFGLPNTSQFGLDVAHRLKFHLRHLHLLCLYYYHHLGQFVP